MKENYKGGIQLIAPYCSDCGEKIDEDSTFCSSCGARTEEIIDDSKKDEVILGVSPQRATPMLNATEVKDLKELPKEETLKEEKPIENTQRVEASVINVSKEENRLIETDLNNQLKNEKKETTKGIDQDKKQVESPKTKIPSLRFINTTIAPSVGGQMFFTQPTHSNYLPIDLSPIKYLLSGIKKLFKGLPQLKDKKKLIPVLIISVLWFLLLILPIYGVNNSVIRLLSYITFARGGTTGGLLGLIGGTIGKGLFVYMVTIIITPLFSGQNPFKSLFRGLGVLKNSINLKNQKSLIPLLIGIGLSLITFNFLSGNVSFHNSMVGISAFVLTLRSLSRQGGFLRGFIMSVMVRFGKDKGIDLSNVNGVMGGLATGFAFSVPLSIIPFSTIGYLVGLIIMTGAIVLNFSQKSKGEVVTG